MYYKDASAICVVYDTTKKKSFEVLDEWVKDIEENMPDGALIVVVGSKSDMVGNEEVSMKEGIEFAKKIKALYV